MEALGLVIIVLLVVVGIVLLVIFGKNKAADKSTGYNQKLAESLVSSIPDTEATCTDRTVKIKDAIRSCSLGSECTCLRSATGTILENSLQKWGYEYTFEITGLNEDISHSYKLPTTEGEPCAKKPRKVAAEQPVPLMAGGERPAFIRLRICYD